MTPAVPQFPTQALRGVRVLDFSHVIAGPFATFHLAQLGAEVTKVEKPGGGDVMRRTASGARAFTALNAGKLMREIDIAAEGGRAEVLALARGADVMVDNYRPGVLRRHGLGYDDVKAVNPRIIYCAISGYGYSDPARVPQGAYDHVIQAFTGMTMLAGIDGDLMLERCRENPQERSEHGGHCERDKRVARHAGAHARNADRLRDAIRVR